jgi:hypothetical protein
MSPVPWKELEKMDSEAYNALEAPLSKTKTSVRLEGSTTDWANWQNAPERPVEDKFPTFDGWEELTYDMWPLTTKMDLPKPPVEEPPKPTKALSITADRWNELESLEDLTRISKIDWQFFATDFGKKVECRTDPVYHEEREVDLSRTDIVYYPGGEFALRLFNQRLQVHE